MNDQVLHDEDAIEKMVKVLGVDRLKRLKDELRYYTNAEWIALCNKANEGCENE